nr:hypothetical protein HmN_000626300 [Hymenolepis microstoma]
MYKSVFRMNSSAYVSYLLDHGHVCPIGLHLQRKPNFYDYCLFTMLKFRCLIHGIEPVNDALAKDGCQEPPKYQPKLAYI